ncbi:UNVERIFIED_CONTAM: hypothetical protein NCL1_39058 [Trichonephila clavipes]
MNGLDVDISDETWFHLSGYVNSQNDRFCTQENPHNYHHKPMHDQKVKVWCAVLSRCIIGIIFFHQTLFIYSTTMDHIYIIFTPDRGQSDLGPNLPLRSLNLLVCNYFLWGTLKSKVYRINPHSTQDLQLNISD